MNTKRGRPQLLEPRRRINIHVREDLYARFTLLHFNEAKLRAEFGSFSQFVNEALEEYLMKNERV